FFMVRAGDEEPPAECAAELSDDAALVGLPSLKQMASPCWRKAEDSPKCTNQLSVSRLAPPSPIRRNDHDQMIRGWAEERQGQIQRTSNRALALYQCIGLALFGAMEHDSTPLHAFLVRQTAAPHNADKPDVRIFQIFQTI